MRRIEEAVDQLIAVELEPEVERITARIASETVRGSGNGEKVNFLIAEICSHPLLDNVDDAPEKLRLADTRARGASRKLGLQIRLLAVLHRGIRMVDFDEKLLIDIEVAWDKLIQAQGL